MEKVTFNKTMLAVYKTILKINSLTRGRNKMISTYYRNLKVNNIIYAHDLNSISDERTYNHFPERKDFNCNINFDNLYEYYLMLLLYYAQNSTSISATNVVEYDKNTYMIIYKIYHQDSHVEFNICAPKTILVELNRTIRNLYPIKKHENQQQLDDLQKGITLSLSLDNIDQNDLYDLLSDYFGIE